MENCLNQQTLLRKKYTAVTRLIIRDHDEYLQHSALL